MHLNINIFILLFLATSTLYSQKFGGANDPNAFKNIGLQNPYGINFPLDTKISYKDNYQSTFEDLFNKNGKPKLFILGYYQCEAMCDAIREILFADLKANNDVKLGEDYEIIMLSIDHEETIGLAVEQEQIYFNRYFSDLPESSKKHILFTVSTKEEIEKLASKIGFEYRYNEDFEELKNKGRQKYDHPSFVYVISDEGMITSGSTSGRFSDNFLGMLKDAQENSPSMDFEELYSMTCLKGNIENENPQNAFNLVKFTSTWFVFNLVFIFSYNYLSRRKGS